MPVTLPLFVLLTGTKCAQELPLKRVTASPALSKVLPLTSEGRLTLESAVSIALQLNSDLQFSLNSLAQASSRKRQSLAAFFPSLSASGTYTQLNQTQQAQIAQSRVTLVDKSQPQLGLNLSWVLDVSGQLAAICNQASYQTTYAELDLRRIAVQVQVDTTIAYYEVLRRRELLRVSEKNLESALAQLTDSEAKYRRGAVAGFDVTTNETTVANARQALLKSRNDFQTGLASLNSVMGVQIDSVVTLPEDVQLDAPTGQAPSDHLGQDPSQDLGPEYADLVQRAFKQRVELLQAQANLNASRQGLVVAGRSLLPTVVFGASEVYSPNAAGLAPQRSVSSLTLSVSVPMFDAGLAKARREEARAQIATAEQSIRQVHELINVQTRLAYLNERSSRNQVFVNRQALTQAEEAYRLAKVRYDAGTTTSPSGSPLLEVTNALAQLTLAKTNYTNSLYDHRGAVVRLAQAVGNLDPLGSRKS